jgi:hypothetical protein
MIRLKFSLAALVSLIVAAALTPASAAQAANDKAAEHARVINFWTPDKVARAVPRDFVLRAGQFQPTTKPPGVGGGGGGGASTVLGASWTGGGLVAETTGKVLFALGSSTYACSASVVADGNSGQSVVLTAGHCVYDETNRRWATNWMFVPDYDAMAAPLTTSGSFCASTLHGCWAADRLVASSEFTTAGGFNTQATLHDYAFAVVSTGGLDSTSQLDATVGAQQASFSQGTSGGETYLFGYPAAGKYKGKDLVYSRGPLGTDPWNSNLTYQVASQMTGGASGGPWLQGFSSSTGSGTIMSVTSYGYSGVKALFGPKLNAEAQGMLAAAEASSGPDNIEF